MRTRAGSAYSESSTPPAAPDVTHTPMEMDALDAAISSLDTNAPVTTEALAQLLRGLAVTITKSLNDTIVKKDAQIEDLKVRVVSLEERCDDLEQYSRRNTVRIRGLAEAATEDTDGLVRDLAARKLDVKIDTSDVVRSHRVGKKTEDRSAPRDIIVRFTMHNTKTAVMRNARKLKGTHLFVNEDMTRSRATIAWEARTLKREGKILDTWTRDGTIFVKVGENAVKSFVTPRTWKAFTHKL